MRQFAQQVELEPEWKQEVNRRLAEHKGRRAASTAGQQLNSQPQPQPQHPAGSRAAAAAARVAARYAKAPSYSEMLAGEARAAVRAAEAASRAALEAQAVAESVLAGLEAHSSANQFWEPDLFPVPHPEPVPEPVRGSNSKRPRGAQAPSAPPQAIANSHRPRGAQAPSAPPQAITNSHRARGAQAPSAPPQVAYEIRWDTDLPVREPSPVSRASRTTAAFESPAQQPWDPPGRLSSPLETDGFELVEPAQPIHANLIEFPRELVATRKVRPRRAEGPYARSIEALGQLSIFEVDPGSISIDVPTATAAAADTFVGPRWSGIELDEEPQHEEAVLAAPAPWEQANPEQSSQAQAMPAAPAAILQPAPTHRRVLATVVDFCLISAAFLASAVLAAANVRVLPPIREMEIGSAVALALITVLYQAVFFTLAKATPGMKYARVELRTFDNQRPARARRCARMAALLLSVLPAGLGILWALFDDRRLCWHDHISGTYPRKA